MQCPADGGQEVGIWFSPLGPVIADSPCSSSAHIQQPCRPSLLLDKEFQGIEGNLKALEEAMPGADVRQMVAAQPLFLSEDIKVILGELRRCAFAHLNRFLQSVNGWQAAYGLTALPARVCQPSTRQGPAGDCQVARQGPKAE